MKKERFTWSDEQKKTAPMIDLLTTDNHQEYLRVLDELGVPKTGYETFQEADSLRAIMIQDGILNVEVDYLHWGEDGQTWYVKLI